MSKNNPWEKLWDWWGAIVGLWKRLKDTRELILWIVALGGLPTATLAAYWKATDSDLAVNMRLLMLDLLVLGAGFVALLWFSRRKEKKIEELKLRLPKDSQRRVVIEEMILELLWRKRSLPSIWIKSLMPAADVRLIEYHLRVFADEGLVKMNSDGKWTLLLPGERYVISTGLHQKEQAYFPGY